MGSRKEETVVIAWAMMSFLADLVFNSMGTRSRAYEAEIDRYFQERRVRRTIPKKLLRTR